ncbi:MAG TPA: methionine ABC transporter ATP-binding protein, partial [Clostridiaceae bacterium]|nr:methionine ABC transporter ATP-binding protein [Clostridiaceae bacterium]
MLRRIFICRQKEPEGAVKLIIIENLTKYYGALKVIDDVSFTIKKGEIFGIIGKSGVGKSTLLRTLNALESMSSGDIHMDGVKLSSLTDQGIRTLRKKVSMIFQNFNLLHQKSALDNVMLPLEIWGIEKHVAKEKAETLLGLVGLEDKLHSKPRNLSGGEKQRVAIARALALDPEILLCDEATSALDPKTTKEILQLLKDLSKKLGLTLVVVTHQMEVVKEICQRVCVMESGRVAALGPVDE